MRSFRQAIVVFAMLALAGCAVGPNFHPPQAPTATLYTASPLPSHTANAPVDGGVAQRFAFARNLSAQWWRLFRSPALDSLIKRGLADSPTLLSARAALREARENFRATSGTLWYPNVDATLGATRQRSATQFANRPRGEFNLYNASVNISYTLSFAGGLQRRIEASRARVDYQRYQFEAAYLALSGNIVTSAIKEASLSAQIAATHAILAAERKQLMVVQRQLQLGAVARTAVLSQQSQLAQTRAMLPRLNKQLAYTRHALAVLAGQLPGTSTLPRFRLDTLTLPQVLPVSLPSSLVRQRPDIRAAEALLHQASAEVGVATANLYPQITLNGDYGSQAISSGELFTGQGVVWSVGAGLLQPLFHGGALSAKRRAAIAAYDQAAAQYRQTVLQAFRNVADVLRALDTDAQRLQAQAAADAVARTTLALTRRRFQLGAVSDLSLLAAQRDAQRARIYVITARAQRYADTAALFQALGGGWWKRDAPVMNRGSK